MSTPARWTELDRRRRSRAIITTAIAVILAWIVLFGAYYLVPFDDLTSRESVIRLVFGIAAFIVVLAVELHGVKRADLPGLRAVQALGVTIPLFLVVFAVVYLSMSQSSTTHFSEPLDHTGALYLVITVFSTVGFGDITPESGGARILISIQMLLDLIVIGAVVRLLVSAAKSGLDGDT
jgi:voltage-gated potassium channel